MGNLRIPQKINSVSSFIKAIFNLRNLKISEYALSSYWFFRGQKNSSWRMIPNVFRNDALKYEFDSIETAIRQRPYDFRECSTDFEILTKLQHYGLGTRLLDVTLNPLVALYFASENHEEFVLGKDGRGKYVPCDGKVVYRYGYGHKLSELEVRIACALPFIEFAEDLTLSGLFKELYSKKVITPDEQVMLEDNNYEKFIHAMEEVVTPHSEPHPNIQQIVDKYLSESPDLVKQVIHVLEEGTSVIDWWLKDSAVSRINRDITRILQTKMSMQTSKVMANNIVKEILIPQNQVK